MTEDKTKIEVTEQITKQPESVVKIKNPKTRCCRGPPCCLP